MIQYSSKACNVTLAQSFNSDGFYACTFSSQYQILNFGLKRLKSHSTIILSQKNSSLVTHNKFCRITAYLCQYHTYRCTLGLHLQGQLF